MQNNTSNAGNTQTSPFTNLEEAIHYLKQSPFWKVAIRGRPRNEFVFIDTTTGLIWSQILIKQTMFYTAKQNCNQARLLNLDSWDLPYSQDLDRITPSLRDHYEINLWVKEGLVARFKMGQFRSFNKVKSSKPLFGFLINYIVIYLVCYI